METKCKFSVDNEEPTCAFTVKNIHYVKCKGYSADKEECPFWNK